MLAVGKGVTVIVNETGDPGHPLATGVTVIVAITGDVPAFVAIKEDMFPEPLAGRPIVELLIVQLKTVPVTDPLNVTAFVEYPWQTIWFAG